MKMMSNMNIKSVSCVFDRNGLVYMRVESRLVGDYKIIINGNTSRKWLESNVAHSIRRNSSSRSRGLRASSRTINSKYGWAIEVK